MNQSKRIGQQIPMVTYLDILNATTPQALTEMSMSRIFQHFQEGESFAVISATKDWMNSDQAYEATGRLFIAVRSMGYGYFGIKGVGQDNASGRAVIEQAVMVPHMAKADALRIGGMFDQFSVLYHGTETGPGVVWEVRIGDGGNERVFTEFHPDKMGAFYSQWKGHTFTFESLPTDNSERRARALRKLPGIDL